MTRLWPTVLGFIAGAALLGYAWLTNRAMQSVALRVSTGTLLQRQLDTAIALPARARYQLVLDFAIPPGAARGPLSAAGPFVEFEGDVAGTRWSTSESGGTGTYGSGAASAGFFVGQFTGLRGDTVRLTVRALPALEEWQRYAPTLELRRHFTDTMYAPLMRDIGGLAGVGLMASSGFAYWRTRRRVRSERSQRNPS